MMFYFCGGAIIGRPFLVPTNFVRDSALDVPFFPAWRPMVAATFIFRRGGHWPPVFSFQNFVRDGALDVLFFLWRPMVAATFIFRRGSIGHLLVSKTSYGTAPSTSLLLPSFPFPHSNTLRQADMACLIY